MTRPQLDSDRIAAGSGEYDRIEEASDAIGNLVRPAVKDRGFRLWWSWGDSKGWRLIIGIPTEREMVDFKSTDEHAAFARHLTGLIKSVIVLDDGFKLYLELDTDERVDANEGWFLRIKSGPQPGHEFVFVWDGEKLADA